MLDGVGGHIRIAAWKEPGLRGGDLVSLSIIKRLDGNKWAVGINGRVYPAFSALDLEPGAVLSARVSTAGRRLVLTLETKAGDPALQALLRQGLAGGEADGIAAAGLLKAGLSVTAEIVEKMKTAMAKSSLRKERAARGLAAMADKGLDISGRSADRLLETLGFGEGGGGERERYRRGGLPEGRTAGKSMRAVLPGSAGKPDALAVFNHLKGRNQSWIVVPYIFGEGPEEIAGTIKLLFDPYLGKPLAMTVSVNAGGNAPIDFYLSLSGKRNLSVFCADPALRTALMRGFAAFSSKIDNMGFEVDDSIYGNENFDGFSPDWEGASVRGVDTVG